MATECASIRQEGTCGYSTSSLCIPRCQALQSMEKAAVRSKDACLCTHESSKLVAVQRDTVRSLARTGATAHLLFSTGLLPKSGHTWEKRERETRTSHRAPAHYLQCATTTASTSASQRGRAPCISLGIAAPSWRPIHPGSNAFPQIVTVVSWHYAGGPHMQLSLQCRTQAQDVTQSFPLRQVKDAHPNYKVKDAHPTVHSLLKTMCVAYLKPMTWSQ